MHIMDGIRKRCQLILYTLRHKAAFLRVEKETLGHNTVRGFLHDLDKPFLYCLWWLSKQQVTEIHRKHNKHHVRNTLPKTRSDHIETLIDWECARLTKPDKPLNAYETLEKFYPDYREIYLPLIWELWPHQVPQHVTKQTIDVPLPERNRSR